MLNSAGKFSAVSEVQVNFHKIRPEVRVSPQNTKSQSHLGERQFGIPKESSPSLWFQSPEEQKFISLSKPKSTFLSIAPRLLIRVVVYHFTKLQIVADHHSSRLFHLSHRPVSRPQSLKSSPFVFS
ncbi:hypothetical protein AVEN_215943-1 [Araneus ventricosus]|uniref:Uncharacterized protein n=1 Tax=Araneus ventricosus TaxID=182803 RepID=A0A4Y2HH70_ARAVE|nr:hypothetical protein AVEN_215943-1 [Araneus ventricosus]